MLQFAIEPVLQLNFPADQIDVTFCAPSSSDMDYISPAELASDSYYFFYFYKILPRRDERGTRGDNYLVMVDAVEALKQFDQSLTPSKIHCVFKEVLMCFGLRVYE